MNGQRNIRPANFRPKADGPSLAPMGQRHIELLRRINSPLIHILEILKRGSDGTKEHASDFVEQWFQSDIRPSALIFCTCSEDLPELEAMDVEAITEFARETFGEIEHPAKTALAWQLFAMKLGTVIEFIATCKTQKN